MAKAMGIVLTGTAIGVGNQFLQDEGVNFRMGMAGLMAGLFLSGIEKLNEKAGTGLATIYLITVLFTPFKGNSPFQELAKLTKPNHNSDNARVVGGAVGSAIKHAADQAQGR